MDCILVFSLSILILKKFSEEYSLCYTGDSGGALIVGAQNHFLAGITSFGNCTDDLPEVYTRVSKFLDWIVNLGKDESDVQEGGCLLKPQLTPFFEVGSLYRNSTK